MPRILASNHYAWHIDGIYSKQCRWCFHIPKPEVDTKVPTNASNVLKVKGEVVLCIGDCFKNYHESQIPASAQLQPDQDLIQEILEMEQEDDSNSMDIEYSAN